MEDIPFFHSYDATSKRLTIRGATYFPTEIFRYADAIELLDMSHGQLTALPPEFGRLKKLRLAFFSHNLFTELPTVLAQCTNLEVLGFKSCQLAHIAEQVLPPNLRWLILTDNHLKTVPASIGQLNQLQKLALAGNQLTDLPAELAACQQLELIRLGANQLTATPDWLPQLPRLAWYGDAGNPCSNNNTETTVVKIPWVDLELGKLLGESPSSQVFKALHKPTQQLVAVKLYQGTLTSDGFPSDDMHINLAAGTHSNLVQVLGQLIAAPAGKVGLVFVLVPASYHNLGLPPSLTTCTRDTYHAGTTFTLPVLLNILRGIAAAGAHLHARGIMHGDLYAHNILVDAAGHALLGDFGAASLYNPILEPWRETIDLRAFQHLVEELTSRCRDTLPKSLLTMQSVEHFADIDNILVQA